MKVIAVGSFEGDETFEEFKGRPIVVLSGTFDEVREAGEFLYDEVHIAKAVPTQSEGK